ncbi:hypothetical protein D3C76_1724300 [compost metagenome]
MHNSCSDAPWVLIEGLKGRYHVVVDLNRASLSPRRQLFQCRPCGLLESRLISLKVHRREVDFPPSPQRDASADTA